MGIMVMLLVLAMLVPVLMFGIMAVVLVTMAAAILVLIVMVALLIGVAGVGVGTDGVVLVSMGVSGDVGVGNDDGSAGDMVRCWRCWQLLVLGLMTTVEGGMGDDYNA